MINNFIIPGYEPDPLFGPVKRTLQLSDKSEGNVFLRSKISSLSVFTDCGSEIYEDSPFYQFLDNQSVLLHLKSSPCIFCCHAFDDISCLNILPKFLYKII